jgi:hypothetical protein
MVLDDDSGDDAAQPAVGVKKRLVKKAAAADHMDTVDEGVREAQEQAELQEQLQDESNEQQESDFEDDEDDE